MADVAPFDVVEQILVRLDVKDLIRYKSICKPWRSLISSPRFVKAHLNHSYNNDRNNRQLGHRRIDVWIDVPVSYSSCRKKLDFVGSCNGLVCVSPLNVEFFVTNPLTLETNKLPKPPYMISKVVCWGFGYDPSADDYKVVAGFDSKKLTRFYALALKSNTWKVIGEVKSKSLKDSKGVLCGGALHWLAKNNVIISLDLSTEEFKEIPLPINEECEDDRAYNKLGVIEECLFLYSHYYRLPTKKWVMKNNKWELYNDDHCETKYNVVHSLTFVVDLNKKTSDVIIYDDSRLVSCNQRNYTCASHVFVQSLVSPHPHVDVNSNNYDGQKRNVKV
ncbi:putative F-box protein At3g16210 [Bidens hawaiensis]|uniref:putative F-box protein At3g16210 n=1 Tax=Bidens hawaiensis TaxID=980011 RepID=UPI00404B38C6